MKVEVEFYQKKNESGSGGHAPSTWSPLHMIHGQEGCDVVVFLWSKFTTSLL